MWCWGWWVHGIYCPNRKKIRDILNETGMLYVEVPNKYSNLIFQISWSRKEQTIDLKASFYIKMDFSRNDEIYKLLNLINYSTNIGHFQINESFRVP